MYGKREGGGPPCPVRIINIWSAVCAWKKGLAPCLSFRDKCPLDGSSPAKVRAASVMVGSDL